MSLNGLKVGDKVIVSSKNYHWLKLGIVYGFQKVDTSRVLIRIIGVSGGVREGHAGGSYDKVDENLNPLPELPSDAKGYWWVGASELKSVGSTF